MGSRSINSSGHGHNRAWPLPVLAGYPLCVWWGWCQTRRRCRWCRWGLSLWSCSSDSCWTVRWSCSWCSSMPQSCPSWEESRPSRSLCRCTETMAALPTTAASQLRTVENTLQPKIPNTNEIPQLSKNNKFIYLSKCSSNFLLSEKI